MAKSKDPQNKKAKPTPKGKTQELEEQIDSLVADLKRARADYLNFQRRSESERAQISRFVKEEVVVGLLPVIDDLKRALTHLPEELESNEWAKGVAQAGRRLDSALVKLGVTPIPATGKEFDPELHEAVNFEDGAGEFEQIVEEIQTGYTLEDKVIRPSMVKVKKVKQINDKAKEN